MADHIYYFNNKVPVVLDDEGLDKKISIREILEIGRLNISKNQGHGPSPDISVRLHKLLTGYDLTDHIDGDTLNNRLSNLRPATHAQNMLNRKLGKNNTSGYKGVYWNKRHTRWVARVRIDGKTVYYGEFLDKEDAAKMRDLKELELRPNDHEFLVLNFPELHEGGCASCKAYEK
jgi:HNH endonuclease/AP2 domain